MAQTHTWFATSSDVALVLEWVRNAGAVGFPDPLPVTDIPVDGRKLLLHFPTIGPIECWPDQIRLQDVPANGPRWREAVFATLRQEWHPGSQILDASRSAAAGLRLPEFRDGHFWVAGCLAFTGSRLRQTFPEFARICQRFDRWISRFPTVFDNRKSSTPQRFDDQLRMGGTLQRVVALPEAHRLLENGAYMIDHMTSPRSYRMFKLWLEREGRIG